MVTVLLSVTSYLFPAFPPLYLGLKLVNNLVNNERKQPSSPQKPAHGRVGGGASHKFQTHNFISKYFTAKFPHRSHDDQQCFKGSAPSLMFVCVPDVRLVEHAHSDSLRCSTFLFFFLSSSLSICPRCLVLGEEGWLSTISQDLPREVMPGRVFEQWLHGCAFRGTLITLPPPPQCPPVLYPC